MSISQASEPSGIGSGNVANLTPVMGRPPLLSPCAGLAAADDDAASCIFG